MVQNESKNTSHRGIQDWSRSIPHPIQPVHHTKSTSRPTDAPTDPGSMVYFLDTCRVIFGLAADFLGALRPLVAAEAVGVAADVSTGSSCSSTSMSEAFDLPWDCDRDSDRDWGGVDSAWEATSVEVGAAGVPELRREKRSIAASRSCSVAWV